MLFSKLLSLAAVVGVAIAAPAPMELEGMTFEVRNVTIDGRDVEVRSICGKTTWYYAGPASCGGVYKDSDWIVSLPPGHGTQWAGPNCGRKVSIRRKATGVVHHAPAVDTCAGGCSGGIDLSPALFKQFAPLSQGYFQGCWDWW